MKRKIIVNNKEFTMPKMSIDTYTEYLELAEVVDAKQRYSKQDIEAMGLFICKAYGDQFTVTELMKSLSPLQVTSISGITCHSENFLDVLHSLGEFVCNSHVDELELKN